MVVGVEELLPSAQAATSNQRRWHGVNDDRATVTIDRPLLAPVVGGYTVISEITISIEGSLSNEKNEGTTTLGYH